MMQPERASTIPVLKTETGEAYDIPVEGSLGLLALGYAGVMLWREKRAAVRNIQPPIKPDHRIS
jgi:hypothetical protein